MLCNFSSNSLKKNYPERKVSEATSKTSGREENSYLSLISPHLSKDRPSKRISIVINPFARNFFNQGRLTHHRRESYKSTPHPNSHKLSYLPSIFLRSCLSFLKIIYFPPSDLHSPSPFHIKMVYKLSKLDIWEVFTFFSVMPLVHNNKN